MLTKEECEKALDHFEKCYWDQDNSYGAMNGVRKDLDILNKLIHEHFDNPPLTIDDLKRDQEVYFKAYGETVLIRGVDKEENLVFLSAIDRKCELEYEFEPNCFYRKKVNG